MKNKTGSDYSSDRFRLFYPGNFKPTQKTELILDQKTWFDAGKAALNKALRRHAYVKSNEPNPEFIIAYPAYSKYLLYKAKERIIDAMCFSVSALSSLLARSSISAICGCSHSCNTS